MRNPTTLLLALLCLPFFSICQNKIDSLKFSLIHVDKKDTAALSVYYQISQEYARANEFDSTIVWIQKVIDFDSTKAGNKYLSKALITQGQCYYYNRDFKKAISRAEKGISLTVESYDLEMAYNLISVSYIEQGNLLKAIEYSHKDLELSKKMGDLVGQGKTLNNIGNIHYDSGNFEEAIKYYQQSISTYKSAGAQQHLLIPLNGIGIALKESKQYDEAIPYFEKSMSIADSLGNMENKAMAVNNLGLVYVDKKEYKIGEIYLKEAMAIYEKTENIGGIADVSGDLGRLQLTNKNSQSALGYCKKSYKINKPDGYLEGLEKDCRCLYNVHKNLGNSDKALFFHEKWKTYSDSLFSASKARELTKTNMSFEFENEKKILALEQKRKEDLLVAKNKQTQTAALGLGAFALLALGFFYNARRKNQLISAQKEQLESLNHTKDRIFAIIGHDLRKPAASFRGISKKVKYLIKKQDFETLDKFGNQIEKNAYSLNKLTDNLLNWALTQRDVMPYNPIEVPLGDLAADIHSIFETPADEKNIKIINNVPQNMTVYADPNALSTILTNLVDNAVKYTPDGGKIRINALEEGSNQLKIRVSDTGIGMEKDKINDLFLLKKDKSEKGTSGEKGTGLGLHLVKELVELNKGIITATSELGKGTSFDLLLPKVVSI